MKLKLTKQELLFLMNFIEEFQQNVDFNFLDEQLEILRAAARDFITKNVPRILSHKDSFKIKLSLTDAAMLNFCVKYISENNSAEVIDFKSRMVMQLDQEMLSVESILNSPLNFFG